MSYHDRENERIEKELAAWQKQSSQQSELTDELKLENERLTAENHEYQTALGLIESEWASTPNDKGLIASKSLLNTAQFAAQTLQAENEILHRKLELLRAALEWLDQETLPTESMADAAVNEFVKSVLKEDGEANDGN